MPKRLPNFSQQKTVGGYPVADPDQLGLTDYFKANPQVAGMAWGGGENGSDPSEPRVVVANPFNQSMADKTKRDSLLMLEAARHRMNESGIDPDFAITPEQTEWRRGLGAYATDDRAFKQSIVSRLLVGDEVPGASPDQRILAEKLRREMTAPSGGFWNPASKYPAKR